MSTTILLAGGTGMFGGKIAEQLSTQPADIRLLVRPESVGDVPESLLRAGVRIVEGNLKDESSLDRATEGVDVIVSAVQGGPEIVVDGQVALARAGQRNGVRHMLPSDYALDIFKATPGEHPMFDQRVAADNQIAETGIGVINILQGAFMMMVANGFTMMPGAEAMGLPIVDHERRIARFWGTGDEEVEATSMDDTARMIAHVALDPDVPDGKFAFYSEKVSFNNAVDIMERRTGTTYDRASLGNELDLRKKMAEAEGQAVMMLPYALYMLNGQTSLSDLQNDRFSNVEFESLADYIARTM